MTDHPQPRGADETIRLRLDRHGDEWDLAGATRGGFRLIAQTDDALQAATIADLGPDATSPGEVLEAVGRVLDRREAERITAAGGGRSTEVERDVARLVEVLEDGVPRDVATIARRLVIPEDRVRRALEQAAADDVVDPWARQGIGLVRVWGRRPLPSEAGILWKIRRDVAELDDRRAAAQDDPRGEADR